MDLEQWRSRVDAFHARFNAKAARKSMGEGDRARITQQPHNSNGPDDNSGEEEEIFCGGCGVNIDRSQSQWCGACMCTAYCDRKCQLLGWKTGGHRAACKLLARAKSLPPADPSRRYVVQLKLAGRQRLEAWASHLERGSEPEVAAVHREMASALEPRERVLFALEARSHSMLKFQVVPPEKRLEASDLAVFTLQSILSPSADVPTLNMTRDAPQRPYAIWIPGPDGEDGGVERSMAVPVGRLLAGAGLATTTWYVGGGFCAEALLRPEIYAAGTQRTGDILINAFATLNPDEYTEDEASDGHDGSSSLRVLIVAGLSIFGPDAGEGVDPFLAAIATALRGAGAYVDVAMYDKSPSTTRRSQRALAQQLTGGEYDACVVLGLGSGDDFKPRRPTYPWGNGPWRDALTQWVRSGGVFVINGERAVAAVTREFFELSWEMEDDAYPPTYHVLNHDNPLLGDLAERLPELYNGKACLLSNVPPSERVYSATLVSLSYSLVPFMVGEPITPGMTAMAAARVGGGAVAFFGDQNLDAPTMAAVAALTKQLVATCGGKRRASGGGSGSGGSGMA